MDAVPPGSYLAISQIASDVAADEVAEGVQRYNAQAAAPVAARTQAEVCRFFAGLELLEPGIVQVHRWRPGTGDLGSGRNLAIYTGSDGNPDLGRQGFAGGLDRGALTGIQVLLDPFPLMNAAFPAYERGLPRS